MMRLIQEGQDAKDSLRVMRYLSTKQDSLIATQQKEIVRKEGVIVRLIDSRNAYSSANDSLRKIMRQQDFVTGQQGQLIQVYESRKEKRFGLGFGLGYGMAVVDNKMGFSWTVGLNLSYNFLRF